MQSVGRGSLWLKECLDSCLQIGQLAERQTGVGRQPVLTLKQMISVLFALGLSYAAVWEEKNVGPRWKEGRDERRMTKAQYDAGFLVVLSPRVCSAGFRASLCEVERFLPLLNHSWPLKPQR